MSRLSHLYDTFDAQMKVMASLRRERERVSEAMQKQAKVLERIRSKINKELAHANAQH